MGDKHQPLISLCLYALLHKAVASKNGHQDQVTALLHLKEKEKKPQAKRVAACIKGRVLN